MRNPSVPYKFLNCIGESFRIKGTTDNLEMLVKQPKSFTDAITNVCDILLRQLLKHHVKGDRLTIVSPDEEYMLGLDACKHTFHGRVIGNKREQLC